MINYTNIFHSERHRTPESNIPGLCSFLIIIRITATNSPRWVINNSISCGKFGTRQCLCSGISHPPERFDGAKDSPSNSDGSGSLLHLRYTKGPKESYWNGHIWMQVRMQ